MNEAPHFFLVTTRDKSNPADAASVRVPVDTGPGDSGLDRAARHISSWYPDGEVRLYMGALTKAVYVRGERIEVHDMKKAYPDMTPEAYQRTKILCDRGQGYV